MSEFLKIGDYQLENLFQKNVRFTYLNLGTETTHPLLKGSELTTPESAVEKILGMNLPDHAPIVLICENGSKSVSVAKQLGDKGFINVIVVDGGVAALSPKT